MSQKPSLERIWAVGQILIDTRVGLNPIITPPHSALSSQSSCHLVHPGINMRIPMEGTRVRHNQPLSLATPIGTPASAAIEV